MDVKFTIIAECRVENIDNIRSHVEIAEMIEKKLEEWDAIHANVKVSGLNYIHKGTEL